MARFSIRLIILHNTFSFQSSGLRNYSKKEYFYLVHLQLVIPDIRGAVQKRILCQLLVGILWGINHPDIYHNSINVPLNLSRLMTYFIFSSPN